MPLWPPFLLLALLASIQTEAAASAVWRRSKAPRGEAWLAVAEVAAGGQVSPAEHVEQRDKSAAVDATFAAADSESQQPDPQPQNNRRVFASDFCAPQLQGYEGTRGAAPPHLVLKQAHVLTRHGSRSPMNELPGHQNQHHFDCSLTPELEERVRGWEERFSVLDHDGQPHSDRGTTPLRPEALPSGECLPGQLTNVGVEEMHELGEYLRDAYTDVLNLTHAAPSEIFAIATNMTRTVMSAAAVLGPMLRDHDGPGAVSHIWSDDAFGYYPSFSGGCPRADRLYTVAERETWERRRETNLEMRDELRTVFSVGPGDSVSNELGALNPRTVTDNVLMSLCNGGPVPCGPDGLCMSPRLIADVADVADQEWCHAYAGSEAGALHSHLAVLPILSEMAQRMKRAVELEDSARFVLLSGHDTTFAALGATFGYWDCTWPPIRSRAVFELWVHEEDPSHDNSYVRHLVNGVPVTDEIEDCPAGEEFCPLRLFVLSIQRLIYPHKTLGQSCA